MSSIAGPPLEGRIPAVHHPAPARPGPFRLRVPSPPGLGAGAPSRLRLPALARLHVAGVFVERPGVISVYMVGENLGALPFEPGQSFRWHFLTRRLWQTSLALPLSAPIWEDTLRVTVRTLGGRARPLRRLRPGTRVVAVGPFGGLTGRSRTRRKVLLLAAGMGVAPLRALFETLPGGPGDVTLVYRARSSTDLLFTHELEAIAQRRQRYLHYLLGPEDGPGGPLTPGRLLELVPDLAEHDVYLCGPAEMTAASVTALLAAGVPRERIGAERSAG
ncbi:hypothetical protein [Planobispora longispora]|uniref:FAD-binding FR-type domain-containing protein n=1 Tax=Planobispora longispora TaxID=28887 RepID=A0A8J3W425_9ACTN|nr:hypothetical protein [Planobispora longispora]GIH75994.1 hypothetical protein Plo01_24230 [Planobispora longispora]